MFFEVRRLPEIEGALCFHAQEISRFNFSLCRTNCVCVFQQFQAVSTRVLFPTRVPVL